MAKHAIAYSILLRVCGAASALGGVLFVAWGYMDTPAVSGRAEFAVQVLSFVVPALFLMGTSGITALGGRRIGPLWLVGTVLAMGGSVLGMVGGITDNEPLQALFVRRGWPPHLSVWLIPLLAGITILGVAAVHGRSLRAVGVVALTIGAVGWCYYLTDSGSVFEARAVHVASGLLYSMGWVVLGGGTWTRGAGYRRGP